MIVAAAQDRDVAVAALTVTDLSIGEGEVGRFLSRRAFGGDGIVDRAHRGDALAASRLTLGERRVGREVGEVMPCARDGGGMRGVTTMRDPVIGAGRIEGRCHRRSAVARRGQRQPRRILERQRVHPGGLVAAKDRGAR